MIGKTTFAKHRRSLIALIFETKKDRGKTRIVFGYNLVRQQQSEKPK